MQNTSIWLRRPALTAATIILVTTLVRLWFITTGQLDLVQDESQYWDWTRTLQLSYYSKGPLIAWVIKIWTSVFGDTQIGVRFGALVNSVLAQGILYWGVGVLMRRPAVAVWTLVIANTTILFNVSSILMTTDNPLLVCWALALFSIYWAGENSDNPVPYILLIISTALGILAKYMMLAMPAIAVLYLLGLYRHKMLPKGFAPKLLGALAIGIAIGFTPILLWNMQNDWVGFRHVGNLAGVASSKPKPLIRFDRFPEYFGSQIGLITPWWFIFMLAGAWGALKVAFGKGSEVLRMDARHIRQNILLAAAFWMLWGFFIVWSFHKRIYPNWSAMSYVGGMILCAIAAERGTLALRRRTTAPKRKKTDARKICVTLGIVTFCLVHALPYLPLPKKLNPATRLMGWHDLGRKLGELQQAMPDPDKVFYFSEAYDITASLAFYAPDQPRAYCADFGRRLSQYDIWKGPQDLKGWDAIFVKEKEGHPVPPPLRDMFEELTHITYETTHRGRPGRSFHIVILKNFNGHWPRMSSGEY